MEKIRKGPWLVSKKEDHVGVGMIHMGKIVITLPHPNSTEELQGPLIDFALEFMLPTWRSMEVIRSYEMKRPIPWICNLETLKGIHSWNKNLLWDRNAKKGPSCLMPGTSPVESKACHNEQFSHTKRIS